MRQTRQDHQDPTDNFSWIGMSMGHHNVTRQNIGEGKTAMKKSDGTERTQTQGKTSCEFTAVFDILRFEAFHMNCIGYI